MKSAATKIVAGHANANKRELRTVCIAPCFINSMANPAGNRHIDITIFP